jgi:hypothetical protein
MAATDLAEDVVGRDANTVELDAAERETADAQGGLGCAGLDGLRSLDEVGGESWSRAFVVGGAREDREELGDRRVGDPALLAVELHGDAVADDARAGRDPRGVRARVALGEREGRDRLAGGELGEVLLVLRVGAEERERARGRASRARRR